MKIIAIPCLLVSLATCATAGTSFAAPRVSSKSDAKGYSATALSDGGIEIVVTGKAGLPTGSQVAVINLRDKLEAAAAKECPAGYDLTDITSSIGAAPNGRGFRAQQRGIARCR